MKSSGYIYLPVLFLLLAFSAVQAQEPFTGGHFWVSFTDKNNSPYSIERPWDFLSQRSLERRASQMISVNQADLPPSPAYIDSLRADAAVEVWYVSRWFNGALVFTASQTALERITSLPFVASVEHVKPMPPETDKVYQQLDPAGIKVQSQGAQGLEHYGLFELGEEKRVAAMWEKMVNGTDFGFSTATIEQINGNFLIADGFLGQGKIIAVLDAGFLAADQLSVFSHLWNTGRIGGTRDFVERQPNVFSSSPHGTYVLSVMAARRPGELMGTATEATYWLLRTEESANEFRIEEYNWLAGAELADSLGADIINSSLGYTRFDDPSQDYTYEQLDGETTVVARAANMAADKGMLVVNSAGNYAQQNWRYIGSPADSFGALSVGAVEISGERAAFSSFGPSADGRIKPDVMAHGRQVPVANTAEGVALANGTSFSSPVIAGMSAALWQKHPQSTAQQIKKAIIESGNRYLRPDTVFGQGIPDFVWASRLLQHNFQPEKQLVLYPNPISSETYISQYSDIDQQVNIEIFDLRGQLVFQLDYTLLSGYNRIQPFKQAHHFNNGIYLLRMTTQQTGEFSVAKFLKAW